MSENLPAVATSGHVTGTSIDNKIAGISGSRAMFATSFDTSDRAGQVKLIGAIGEAEPIDEYLGETINLVDYVAQIVEFVNEDGEMQEGVRIVLIDDEGKSYAAMSDGLMKSLQTFVSVMGSPATWPEPLPIKVVEVKSRRGFKFFTAKLV